MRISPINNIYLKQNVSFRKNNAPAYTRPTSQKESYNVDLEGLERLNIKSFRIQKENQLYSGSQLELTPEIIKGMKKAGINTILSLVPMRENRCAAQAAGINYVELHELKDGKLSSFDVAGKLMQTLIDSPESWAKEDIQKVNALKEFVKILNGKSKQYPLPLYYGCHHGVDRTFMWTELYKALKDCPDDKPLSAEVTQELAILNEDNMEYFKV